ncbi:MAG: P-loop NTPase, partial [Myxococcota bacterium]
MSATDSDPREGSDAPHESSDDPIEVSMAELERQAAQDTGSDAAVPAGDILGATDSHVEESDDDLVLFREPSGIESAEVSTSALTSETKKRRQRPLRIIVVSGAKGGVGKTVFSANLAIYLATIGRRVVLVDADADGASLHTLLGIDRPGRRLSASSMPPEELSVAHAVETTVPGLQLVHGGIDEPALGRHRRTSRRALLAALRSLDADHLVVDLGTGTSRSLLDFWLAADQRVFLATPEPTSIDNTYRFLRAAYARFLKDRAKERGVSGRLTAWLRRMGNTPAPLDLARRLEAAGDDLSELVRDATESFDFRLVLNQARVRADLELGEAMTSAARRRFGIELGYLGYVDYDDTVWNTIRIRRPLLVESPGTKAAKSIEKIARRLLAIDAGTAPKRRVRHVPAESHHDLLEVERGASEEEVRRSFKRLKEIYSPGSLSCYGLFDATSLEALRARLEEAYDVLLDPARRRPYELSVFPRAEEPISPPDAGDE